MANPGDVARCRYCLRRVFLRGDGVWTLVYREYDRSELCDARDMDAAHDPRLTDG